ncbi:neuromedin-U [Nelusetta ayraudi]|uniref:neuromedin-U n=1 Tax=Nelusetta ayraudi TaxID=303726 RepID=UPI003F73015A
MRNFRSQSQGAQREASSSLSSLSSSSSSSSSITVAAALLLLTIPVCHCAPTEVQKATRDQTQVFNQLDTVCSFYLSADPKFLTSDALGELCVLMLIQKSKEVKVRENSKRAELQGPGGIQSRGYFLYRPRNGRRSLEYE